MTCNGRNLLRKEAGKKVASETWLLFRHTLKCGCCENRMDCHRSNLDLVSFFSFGCPDNLIKVDVKELIKNEYEVEFNASILVKHAWNFPPTVPDMQRFMVVSIAVGSSKAQLMRKSSKPKAWVTLANVSSWELNFVPCKKGICCEVLKKEVEIER